MNELIASFQKGFHATFIQSNRYLIFIDGFKATVTIAFFALLIGMTIGVFIGVVKVFSYRTGKLKALDRIADVYLTVFRGTPVMVQLMIWYYVILVFISQAIYIAIIGFGINSGAYMAEIVRAGILSIDKGQTEAGRSLGLSEASTMRFIVLPQAVKNTLPAFFNEFISLLKETSIAGTITVIDLTKAGDLVRSRTFMAFFPLMTVALIYLLIVTLLTLLQKKLERRLQKSDRR
jgi:His/Glu/Gln/Arg/opine family amino acid ABC transporter permease subunit